MFRPPGLQVAPLPSRLDRSPDRFLRAHGVPGVNLGAPGPRYNARLLRSLRDRPSPAARHALGLDGLGDRDRSLSPEVWGTLVSTLTPDPQPPSAGSSFVSAAASQSADPFSGTPIPVPDVAEDAQCDSCCEHSDVDMDEDEDNVGLAGGADGGSRRLPRRAGSARVPPYNANDTMDGPARRPAAPADGQHTETRRPADSSSPGILGRNARATEAPRGMPLARLLNGAEGWARQHSAEASEEERGADGSQRNREGSARAGHAAALGGEEEWLGMQRIVRSLARREDIPDEWWAEAGLTRTTLSHDEAANQ